jgi:broad specificity phosphatase PhoE
MKTLGLLVLILSSLVSNAHATPAQIVLLRHAEKPADEEHNELNTRGWKRAHALVDFFLKRKEFRRHGPPVAIYAMGQHKKGSSVRAIQTVTPLAEELGLEINDEYTRDDYEELAEDILSKRKYDGKLVIICWQRDTLPEFAEELGLEEAPKWGSSVFDRAWSFEYDEDDELEKFRDLPQRLLSGDSD